MWASFLARSTCSSCQLWGLRNHQPVRTTQKLQPQSTYLVVSLETSRRKPCYRTGHNLWCSRGLQTKKNLQWPNLRCRAKARNLITWPSDLVRFNGRSALWHFWCQTLPTDHAGHLLAISKTKHRSGISQLMRYSMFGFRRFQFREFLGPKIWQDSFDPQTCQAGTFTHFACMSACCVSES